MNILFMCVANSARSQMAEGLAKNMLGSKATIESAGSNPYQVSPLAFKVMREIGIDLSEHYSKSFEELPATFRKELDYVITLCAEEVCPRIDSRAKKLHWPLPDPVGNAVTEEDRLNRFRQIRDVLKKKLHEFAHERGFAIDA